MIASLDAPTTVALISAAAALGGGAITATINGWLGGREKVVEGLRTLRLHVYPSVWRRTSVLSRWPHTNVSYAGLERLHLDLRTWYYNVGGLYLSENARARYGDLQELLAAHLRSVQGQPAAAISPATYADLSQVASVFRSALTEDLDSRRQRSILLTLRRSRSHRRQARDARTRLRAATAAASGAGDVPYTLQAEDERLQPPAPVTT